MPTSPDQPTNGNVSQNLVSGLSTPMVNSMDAIQQEIATTNRLLNIIIGRGLGGDGQTNQQASGAWAGSGPTAGITMSSSAGSVVAVQGNPNAGQTVSGGGSGEGGVAPAAGAGAGSGRGRGKKKSSVGGVSSDGTFEGLMRGLPIIKWAFTPFDEAIAQRGKNMQYQSVEGGSNAAGFGERFREEGYRFSTMGMFSSQEARTAFKGVTALGYNEASKGAPGQDRQEALDFLYKGKSQYGQTVEEGLNVLQTASKSADISFIQLAKSLQEVADTAGKAGVNAKVAREQFVSAMDAAVAAGYGGGSVTASEIATATAASYGRGYQQNVDTTGQFSRSQRYLTASQFGLSQPQAVNIQRKNPTAWARLSDAKNMQVINTSFSPAFTAEIKKQVKEYGGKDALEGNDALAARIGFDAAEITGENTDAVQDVASALSGNQFLNPDAAMTWIVMHIAGLGDAAQAEKKAKSTATYDTKTGLITEGEFKGQKSTAEGASSGYTMVGPKGFAIQSGGKNDDSWRGKHGGKADAAYDKNYTDKGSSNPVLQALYKNIRSRGADPEKIHVKIGDKVYTFAEAVEKFPNVMTEGNATFVDGGLEGETTGNVSGQGTVNVSDSAAVKRELADAGKGGESSKDWKKEHGDWESRAGNGGFGSLAGGGGGMIGLTPEAKRLVTYMDGSGGNYPPSKGSS